MNIIITRPNPEKVCFWTSDNEIKVDTRSMIGMEIELSDKSIIVSEDNDTYFTIISEFSSGNEFDLKGLNEKYLVAFDDVDDNKYRNRSIQQVKLYKINNKTAYRFEF